MACPPLKALLHIMAHGDFEGRDLQSLKIRHLFARENMLASRWYAERLQAKQAIDTKLWQRHVAYLTKFITKEHYAEEAGRLGVEERLHKARVELKRVTGPAYLDELRGTLGVNPLSQVFHLSGHKKSVSAAPRTQPETVVGNL
jgi:phosphoenolpyruvate carboxykinase (diphosphate)